MAEDELYIIEKILKDRKSKSGKRELLIKWDGYDESYNTWEPVSGIPKHLVQSYDETKLKVEKKAKKNVNPVKPPKTQKTKEYEVMLVMRKTPKKVLGVHGCDGEGTNEFNFVIEFTDGSNEIVDRKLCHKEIPLKVIDYYERFITWHDK